jgi:alcohol dehydrogenase class IV
MNLNTFFSTNAILGKGSIDYLLNREEKRIAIVMGGRSQQVLVEDIMKKLEQAGKDSKIIGKFSREPYMEDIIEPLNVITEFSPDCILAIGGGSVIDSAKILWIFYEYPELKWEDILFPKTVPSLGNKASLIAVPTTSGTGSETSCCSVIIDSQAQEKKLIIHQNILPTLSILDGEVVYSMPSHVAAHSGMDAFSHALEAATSKRSNSLVERIALIALLDIFKYLPTSVNGKSDSEEFKEAREKVYMASFLAGIAINNCGTGLAHTFDQVGPKLNLSHGLTCAIVLPHTVEFVGKHPFYEELSLKLGYKDNEMTYAEFLAEKIVELNVEIGIGESFKDLGIEEDKYIVAMKENIDSALKSGGLQFSPRVPNYEEAEIFMKKSYYGK